MLVFGRLGQAPKELRPLIGQAANQVKQALEAALAERQEAVKAEALRRSLQLEQLDISLPGRRLAVGRLHITNRVLREICRIWGDMGFQVYRSREVETDDYNFGLLNMPPHHPARDMWDTFHTMTPGVVLRTHTSPGQIHLMRESAPRPVRAILPGMCYRYEQISTRAEIQFNQVEGIAIGENITLGDLKGTLENFCRRMYGDNVRTRFRPSYFPFTEPSAEMDVECFVCGGKGCSICKYSGWLEILGSGMVHPAVFEAVGYDPEEYTGFAFGLGVERVAMLKYGIDDLRLFFENDLRFLRQF